MKFTLFTVFLVITVFGNTQTDIFVTDFQSGIPVNYSVVDNDGYTPDSQVSQFTNAWIAVVDPENALDTVAASTSFFNPTGKADRWLITPAITLGAFGNYIEWNAKSQDASFPDDYVVLLSTTDTQLSSFTDTIGNVMQENFEWVNRQANLSAQGYNNQTVYIAFVNNTDDGFVLYIDDIHAWKEDPASVNELVDIIEVSVFPNPSDGIFTVSSTSIIDKIEVMNAEGRVIESLNENKIDLTAFSNGIYFLNVLTDKGQVKKRVIKI